MTPYRRKPRRTETHGDDWLMTYADMITLLLCFFAVFLSLSLPRKKTDDVVVPRTEAVQTVEPFRLPTVFSGTLPFNGVPVTAFEEAEEEEEVLLADASEAADVAPAAGE